MPKHANLDRIQILRLVIFFVAGVVCSRAVAREAPPQPAPPLLPAIDTRGYELTWSEEFNQDGRPDPDVWGFENGFRRNYERQWYQPENAWCADGKLIIEARRVDRLSPDHRPGSDNWRHSRKKIRYTSASLKTQGKKQWLYGRLEVRAKIDAEEGLWPAIWTLGSARSWPACGEVDLMEYYDNSLLANAAWSSKRSGPIWDTAKIPLQNIAKDESTEQWAQRFHVWTMHWTPQFIKLYVNDRLLNEIDLSKTVNRSQDGANPFHEPHYLILNLAIGGSRGGNPANTDFPKRMQVDYVRLYQRKETKHPVP